MGRVYSLNPGPFGKALLIAALFMSFPQETRANSTAEELGASSSVLGQMGRFAAQGADAVLFAPSLLVLAEDNVLMAFPADDLINQVSVLQAGDHVDFLFTYEMPIDRETGFLPVAPAEGVVGPAQEEEAPTETLTFNLLQNVPIASVVRQLNEDGQPVGAPRALLLTITPQDALVLKYMKDVGAVVDLVLRAPGAEGQFAVDPVDLDYIINGYIVPGEGLP